MSYAEEPAESTQATTDEPIQEQKKIPGQGSDTFIQVQPEKIYMTLVDFLDRESIKAVQDQTYSIPGVTDFIPHMMTKGLITYDVHYSGHAKLLFKALRDTIGSDYEISMRETGEKQWEITIKKL